VEFRVTIWEEPSGKWVASSEGEVPASASGATMERCLANLRRGLDRSGRGDGHVTLVVQVVPRLAGVAEAAGIMGWDKRRVITYIDRGSFPKPLQSLASGRVWFASDIERFKDEWAARRARLARKPKRGIRKLERPAANRPLH
jgi:hypothetical protein